MKSKGKTIVFIRHAQSNENVKVIRMYEGLNLLRNLRAPTLQQISSTLSISSLTVDSLVSPLGKRQILDMHMILRDEKFWERHQFDLIVCSPLTRAQETCEGLLPKKRDGIEVTTRADLEEATPFEHVFSGSMVTRIENFKRWLATREEQRILIVGHSQYFKRMLGQKSLMRNCDVWQCDFSTDTGNDGTDKMTFEWTNLTLLHRTELSDAHPSEGVKSSKETESKCEQKIGEDVVNDLNEEEPICRICQISSSEDPSQKLIKPCHCSGSAAYVHLKCLNKWRETSRKAYLMCSICNYEYKVKKSPFAALFLNEQAVVACAAIIFVLMVVTMGMVIFNYSYLLEERDLTSTLFRMMGSAEPRWRYCRVNSQKRTLLLHTLVQQICRFNVKEFPFYDLVLCHEIISDSFSSIILGLAAVGLIGILLSLFDEAIKFYRAWGIAGRAALPDIYWSIYWVVFANDRVFAMRLGIPIGCHHIAKKIYDSLLIKGRNLSSYFGEQVIEYRATDH